jgi:hypothetical protein
MCAVSFKWRLVDDPLHIPQTDQCALGVIDSYVYVFGGRLADTTSRDLWIYSVSKVSLSPTHKRRSHARTRKQASERGSLNLYAEEQEGEGRRAKARCLV